MVPDDAIRVDVMGTASDGVPVALWDVSRSMPRHGSKRYRKRSREDVVEQYVHHSGALRQGDPYKQLRGSAGFAIRNRGWPGFGYHTWHPFVDEFDEDGNRVVYLGNHIETRTYHAGARGKPGSNDRGIAHALQGNLTTRDMPHAQLMTLPVTLRYYAALLGIPATPIGHFQAPADGHAKASCPGRAGKAWCLGFQAGQT